MNQNHENFEYNNYMTCVHVNQEVRDFEDAQFSYWMRKYGVPSRDSYKFRYIRDYCMMRATVDSDGVLQVSQDAIFHYISRNTKIKYTNFTKERFDSHVEI